MRAGRAELHETPHRGTPGDQHLRRYTGRLVRGLCFGAEPPDCLCVARFALHPRGARRFAPYRVPISAADYLEERSDRFDQNALLVCARTLLVCSEEECALVREGRGELDDLGFAVA